MRAAALWFFLGFLAAVEIIGVLLRDSARRHAQRPPAPPVLIDLLAADGTVAETRVVASHSGVGAWN
jgi:hypothetical protein